MTYFANEIIGATIISACISVIIYGVLAAIRFREMKFKKHLINFVFLTYTIVVLIGSFSPWYGVHVSYLRLNIIPFHSIWQIITGNGVYNFVIFRSLTLDLALLMPLGFLIPFVFTNFKSLTKVGILALVTSVIIEIIQLIFSGLGRSFDVDDIIFNTLGAIIGYLLSMLVMLVVHKKEKIAE